jgi:hypothetical protein
MMGPYWSHFDKLKYFTRFFGDFFESVFHFVYGQEASDTDIIVQLSGDLVYHRDSAIRGLQQ